MAILSRTTVPENVVTFWFIRTIAIYLRCSKLTSVSQTGRVIGKGQQMKILMGALIVLDLAIIGYISRQLIEMVSILW